MIIRTKPDSREEDFWYVGKELLVEFAGKVQNRGIKFYRNLIDENLSTIRESIIESVDSADPLVDDDYTLNIYDHAIMFGIIECLYEGLIDGANHLLVDKLDTAPRDFFIFIVNEN